MKYVKKTDLISDVIEKYPQAFEIMMNYGLHCVECSLNEFETVEEGSKIHGMSDTEIEKMLNEVNQKIKSKKK